MQLEGKVAAVTGGTRGIGLGIAKAFVDQGASVAVNGRSADKGQQALERLGVGDRAAFFAGDVTRQADAERLRGQDDRALRPARHPRQQRRRRR